MTDVTVRKVWNDNSNSDGLRPESVCVQVRSSDSFVNSHAQMTGNSDIWEQTISGLPPEKTYTAFEIGLICPTATATSTPTMTPRPTNTPLPTKTPTPRPTNTPLPTPTRLYLIQNGQFVNNGISGGWQTRAWSEGPTPIKPEVSNNSDYIYLTQTKDGGGVLETVNDINLTQYTKIVVDMSGEVYGIWSAFLLYVTPRNPQYLNSTDRVAVNWMIDTWGNLQTINSGRNIYETYIGNINGSYDLAIYVVNSGWQNNTSNFYAKGKIYNLWLEK